ncbi:hypothetical protein ACAW74_26110 [Fibrella sp. WM1]|uniref:hypothetical protein n=1 Tax=Fibrella musci TaxID=3242485 RepID=UPI003522973A
MGIDRLLAGPKRFTPEAQVKAHAVKIMYGNKLNMIAEMGQLLHIIRATIYSYLAWQEATGN